jgi:hypothetical protein
MSGSYHQRLAISAEISKSVLSRSSRRKGLVQREPPGHVPLFPASINATRPALPAFSAASRKLNVAVEPAKPLPMTTISYSGKAFPFPRCLPFGFPYPAK